MHVIHLTNPTYKWEANIVLGACFSWVDQQESCPWIVSEMEEFVLVPICFWAVTSLVDCQLLQKKAWHLTSYWKNGV